MLVFQIGVVQAVGGDQMLEIKNVLQTKGMNFWPMYQKHKLYVAFHFRVISHCNIVWLHNLILKTIFRCGYKKQQNNDSNLTIIRFLHKYHRDFFSVQVYFVPNVKIKDWQIELFYTWTELSNWVKASGKLPQIKKLWLILNTLPSNCQYLFPNTCMLHVHHTLVVIAISGLCII